MSKQKLSLSGKLLPPGIISVEEKDTSASALSWVQTVR